VILVTDPFQRAVDERVYVLLAAVHTPSGFSGEMLTAAAITDAMVLAIATQEKARAEATFDQLAVLRQQIARTASDSMRRSRRGNRSR
jgi:DNA-binding MurR/RpiR family transcriptional regulator